MRIEKVVLENDFVRLEPLTIEHFNRLKTVGMDESIWKWTVNVVETESDLRRYVETALDECARKVSLPFVTIDKTIDAAVGSTRFGNIDTKNRRAEIGWTWISPALQRSFVNSNAKLLMLEHAFEVWKCIRVELKTDVLNEKSRRAILRLGAREEGILRQHAITETGRIRDTIYYSILDSEWIRVKENLTRKISEQR